MQINIPRDRLLHPLTLVSNVVERRQTLPILANVYLRLESGRFTVIGTDLEIEITNSVGDVEGKDGECTVTARKLLDICRALPEKADVTLVTDDGKLAIRSGRSRFSLQTLPAEDFPRLTTKHWNRRLELKQRDLKGLLERTAFAMAHQDVRYYLNGLLFEIGNDTLRAVATDGHRLAKSEVGIAEQEQNHQAILPRKTVLEMSRLLDESDSLVSIELNPNHIQATLDNLVFTSKLIDGRFPDYAAIMAPVLRESLLLDRQAFGEMLNRAAILTNEKYRGIRLSVEPEKMSVSASSPDQEEANDEMPIDYEGQKIEIGFNVSYLLDAVKALGSEQIQLRLQDANSSCTLNVPGDTATQYLVMPMRI